MARAIARQQSSNQDVPVYRITIRRKLFALDGLMDEVVLDASSTIPFDANQIASAVVYVDWSDTACITVPVPLVCPFAERSSEAIGDRVVKALLEHHLLSRLFLQTPVHLIGHSRGGGVVSRVAYRLGQGGIITEHVTYLDPQPTTVLSGDWNVKAWNTVWYVDNLLQKKGLLRGENVQGSEETDLGDTLCPPEGCSDQMVHSAVHTYYHGTIDTKTECDTSSDCQDGDRILASWYGTTGAKPPKELTGYARSRVSRRTTLYSVARLPAGVHQAFPGGAAGNRDSITTVPQSPGTLYPNVFALPLPTTRLAVGDTLVVPYLAQDLDSTSWKVTASLDDDTNPYNGAGTCARELATHSFGVATNSSTFVEKCDVASSCKITWTVPSDFSGPCYVRLTASDNVRTRYDYYHVPIRAAAVPPPILSPQITEVLSDGGGDLNGTVASNAARQINIFGARFSEGSRLRFTPPDGTPIPERVPEFVDSTALRYAATFPVSGNWSLAVINPGAPPSQPFSFSIAQRPVQILDAPASVAASDGTYATGVLISWTSVAGADYYEIYRATSTTGLKTKLVGNYAFTTRADTQIGQGTTYYYWVKACKGAGICSALSLPDSGFAAAATASTLGAVVVPDPVNSETGVSINVGELTWQSGGGATKYDVYFGTTPSLGAAQLLGTVANPQRNIAQLAHGTTYYWRVDARNNSQTVTGQVWQFTTRQMSAGDPPQRAVSPMPTNTATDVLPAGATLQWSNGGGATSYLVYFGRRFEPGAEEYVGETNLTSWSLPLLERGKGYYWRVKAKNAAGLAKGDIWSFTTEPDVPSVPSWPIPAAGQLDMQASPVFLRWSDTSRTAKSFDVYFGTSPTLGASALVATVAQGRWETPALQAGTTYYWQIASKNNAGTSFGPIWSFSTWQTAPGILTVSTGGFASVGPKQGPFSPSAKTFTLRNVGQQSLSFSASTTQAWLQVTPQSGTIAPGATASVVASFTDAVSMMYTGRYADSITFSNTTNGRGSDYRAVELAINTPLSVFDVVDFSRSGQTTIGVRSDGTLVGWGAGDFGQLGLGPQLVTTVPAPVAVGQGMRWKKVSMLYQHVLALSDNGQLFGWGGNSHYQLGLGDTTPRYIPEQIGTDIDWVDIVAGDNHSLALKADGRLYGFGLNVEGQLGMGDLAARSQPSQIGTDSNWKSITACTNKSAAIKSDGRLYVWGEGVGSDGLRRLSPTQVGTASDWAQISCRANHFLAIKANGALHAWGSNSSGELGLGDTAARLAPVRVGTENDWILVSAGDQHSLALKSDGRLFGWGDNQSWQVVSTDQMDKTTPTFILQDATIRKISAGYASSMILLTDGTMLVWGNNDGARLGVGYMWAENIARLRNPTKVDFDWAFNAAAPIPVLRSVVSRKVHGTLGGFDLPITLTPTPASAVTVEPRSNSAGHKLIFQFDPTPTSIGAASVTPTGIATAAIVGDVVEVQLGGVPDNRRVTVTVTGVNASTSAQATLGFLMGDVNGSRLLDSGDVSTIKARAGQVPSLSTFLMDLNLSGRISAADVATVKARAALGLQLPP